MANFFSRQGEGGNTKRYYLGDELSSKMHGLIHMDKLGVPSLPW